MSEFKVFNILSTISSVSVLVESLQAESSDSGGVRCFDGEEGRVPREHSQAPHQVTGLNCKRETGKHIT